MVSRTLLLPLLTAVLLVATSSHASVLYIMDSDTLQLDRTDTLNLSSITVVHSGYLRRIYDMAPGDAPGQMFGTDQNGLIQAVRQSDGTFARTFPTSSPIAVLGYDDSSQTLYGIPVLGSAPSNLMRIDRTTGALTTVGVSGLGPSFGLNAMTFDPASGMLFAAGVNSLVRIDPTTGQAFIVGNIAHIPFALAYNPDDGNLYASSSQGSFCTLYTVNRNTGATTLVGTFPGSVRTPSAMVFGVPACSVAAQIAVASLFALRRRR